MDAEDFDLYTPEVTKIMLEHKALLPPSWDLRSTQERGDGANRYIMIHMTNRELYEYDHDDRLKITRVIIALTYAIRKTGIECYVRKT